MSRYAEVVPGSCALMALLDPSQRDLYVACTGDSRAVAGIWEENEDGTGTWRVEVLTEDQTGRSESEAKRCAVLLGSVPATQSIHRFSSTSIHFTHSAYNPNTLQR